MLLDITGESGFSSKHCKINCLCTIVLKAFSYPRVMSSLSYRYFLDSSITVKHWLHYLKVKGLSLVTIAGIGGEKMTKNVLVKEIYKVSPYFKAPSICSISNYL
jgi:hypothetical protein